MVFNAKQSSNSAVSAKYNCRWVFAISAMLILMCIFLICVFYYVGSKADAAEQKMTESFKNELSATESSITSKASSGKILVAYFSAQGHTEKVAETIASAAGADLFEIVPEQIYSEDDLNYGNSSSRVCREHDDESLRDIALTTTTPTNWEDYQIVFVGYPIWWGIAAWPINNFIKDNDFTGKTVIPFATSASSGMGQSASLLQQMTNTGIWQDGQRFSSSASASTVQEWVSGLDLSVKADISTTTVNGIEESYEETGSAIEPVPTVIDTSVDPAVELDPTTDYEVSYANNTDVGTATITITGKGNWTGSKEVNFMITTAPSPTTKDIGTTTISNIKESYEETGSDITPEPIVVNTSVDPAVTLVKDTDYVVSYSDNIAVGTAKVTIIGKGNWSGTNTVTFEITAKPVEASWTRLAGGTALSTMQKIVNAGWETSDYAIVATSQGYQDALSASALAGLLGNAPVLLTKSNELSSQTSKLLTGKSVKNVIIVGGTGAVSEGVESAIAALGCNVERIAGGTATTTATAVYKWGTDASKTGGTTWGKDAIVATLDSFQDALSIAPYAYAKHAPIFLTDKGTKDIRSSVEGFIKNGGFDRTLIVGGTGAVSESVGDKVVGAQRLAGGSAYTTSKEIANFALKEGMTATNMGVACGTTYQDALVGASFLGKLGSIIALADDKNSTTVNSVVAKNKDSLGGCYIFGGTAAVSQTVEDKLNAAIK